MNQQELNDIIAKHKLWLEDDDNGKRADLSSADLLGANLSSANLIVIYLPIWNAYIHAETVRIGCQHHEHDEWLSFDNEEIREMDSRALDWWAEYKPLIAAGIEIIKAQVAAKQPKQKDIKND